MNAVEKAEFSRRNARAARIRSGISLYLSTLADIAAAYAERDWEVLGYDSWQQYVDQEFSESRLRLTPEHRAKAVRELRLGGLSQPAIASFMGISRNTVAKDLQDAQTEQPDKLPPQVKGTDGRTYAANRPSPLPRETDPDHPTATSGEAHAGLADDVLDGRASANAEGVFHTPDAGDGEEHDGSGSSPQTAAEVAQGPADGSDVLPRAEPAPVPATFVAAGTGVTPDQEFMSRFIASLAKSGGWMQFDADRVAELASESTWDAIEAHAGVVAHTYERMRKARFSLRVFKGGAA